jgi:endonuclease YncB( thermonuclease family)
MDCDTFSFERSGVAVRVRIAGFDAPEKSQTMGSAAKDHLCGAEYRRRIYPD